jgi:hypothetical protein
MKKKTAKNTTAGKSSSHAVAAWRFRAVWGERRSARPKRLLLT